MMRTRLLAIPLIAIVAVVGGWSAVACGNDGGGALTLEEFFQRVDELDEDLEAKSAELDEEFDALGDEPTIDEAVGIFRQQIALVDEFVSDLEALDAPPEAEDLLAEAVSAGGEVVQIFNEQVDQAEGAATLDEFFASFDEVGTDAAFQRFEQVCLDAEQLAADNEITIDLDCEDE